MARWQRKNVSSSHQLAIDDGVQEVTEAVNSWIGPPPTEALLPVWEILPSLASDLLKLVAQLHTVSRVAPEVDALVARLLNLPYSQDNWQFQSTVRPYSEDLLQG